MDNPELSRILDIYIRSLIVNTQGDPVRKDEQWPNVDEVLEKFYEDEELDHDEDELEAEFLKDMWEENLGDWNG